MLDGWSGCAISRRLKVTEDTVRRRKKKLARFALLKWAKDLTNLKLNESIAYDGLENFSRSQFDPNNLNHAVGRESYFIYDFNLSAMNRKGRMSARQERKARSLEEKYGKYPSQSIGKDSQSIFERLLKKSSGDLLLHTDKHLAYQRAIKRLKDRNRIVHFLTPGKATRNFKNRLFAINHTDMLTRHKLGNYRRETISFAKNPVAMLESFVLFAVHKNYQRPRFYKKQKRDPLAHKESPAMKLGLRQKIESFREFYGSRISFHHVKMPEEWVNLFDSYDDTGRHTIRPYAGI
jgi:hypothetical protein